MKNLKKSNYNSYQKEAADLLERADENINYLDDIIRKGRSDYQKTCMTLAHAKQQLESEKENKDSTDDKLQTNIRILIENVEVQTRFKENLSRLLGQTLISKERLCRLKKRFLKVLEVSRDKLEIVNGVISDTSINCYALTEVD